MITVGEVMSTDLLTVEDTASLADARRLMTEEHIRHLPVVNGLQEFVGLLTQRDVLASTLSSLAEVDREERDALESSIPVRELMHTDLAVVEEDTSLREAAVYLLRHKIGCLPVVSSGSLVGIVTESDFLKLVIKLLDRFET